MIVVWRNGDTFERLSARWLGDWTLYSLIRSINGMFDEPHPGSAVYIPDDLPAKDQYHIVTAGDSWESVSAKYHGSERLSERIRNANPGSHIYERVGETILIPAVIKEKLYRKLRNA